MKKLATAVMVLGMLAAAGGVVFLHMSGFNATSAELWRISIQGAIKAPSVILQAAFAGEGEGLFLGVSIVLGGLLTTIAGAAIALLTFAWDSLMSVVRSLRSRSSRVTLKQVEREKVETVEGPRPIDRLRGLLKRKDDLEADARLEDSRIIRLVRDLLQRTRDTLSTILARSRSGKIVLNDGGRAVVIAEIAKDRAFYEDLKEWYREVKSSGGHDLDFIARAQKLRERATAATISDLLEEDPMNGAFLMRMMNAWAARGGEGEVGGKPTETKRVDPEQGAINSAIRDVIKNGISVDNEERGVDLDDDEDFIDSSIFERVESKLQEPPAATVSRPSASPALRNPDPEPARQKQLRDHEIALEDGAEEDEAGEILDDAEDDEPVIGDVPAVADGMIGEDDILRTIRVILEIRNQARDVAQGMSEWEDDLVDQSSRVGLIEDGLMDLEQKLDDAGHDRVEAWIRENVGTPEWDWLRMFRSDVEEEGRKLREAVLDSPRSPDDEDDEEASPDDDGDIEAAFGLTAERSPGTSAPSIEESDSPSNMIEESSRHGTDEEPFGADNKTEDHRLPEVDEQSDGHDVDGVGTDSILPGEEGGSSINDEMQSSDPQAPEIEAAETDLDGQDDNPGQADEAANETEIPGASEVDDQPDEVMPHAEKSDEERPAAKSGTGGIDVGLSELEEIGQSDQLLTQWGVSARDCGASYAKLAHVLMSNKGGRRQVDGVAHMLARWGEAGSGDERQLALFFRYLPEGDWALIDNSNGVTMVSAKDEFVRVRREALDHAEVRRGAVVVHFYGPGASPELDRTLGGGLRVVGRALDAVEVESLVGVP